MPKPPFDYKQWLISEIEARKRRNKAYSMRAFANWLGISHATLSQIISGKRPLTLRMSQKLAQRLVLSRDDREGLFNAVLRAAGAGKDTEDGEVSPDLPPSLHYRELRKDQFRLIADWQHYAIRNLAETKDNRADPAAIAKRLGLSCLVVKQSLQRLQRLGLLEIVDGRMHKSASHLTTTTDVPTAAVRLHHRQILAKAALSLRRDQVEERDFSSVTLPFDPQDMVEAKEFIEQFRRRFSSRVARVRGERLYTMAVQFFPLDRIQKKKSRVGVKE